MNLSKKTIKHILRILENKCKECPMEDSRFRGFIVNTYSRYSIFAVFFSSKKGLVFGMKQKDCGNKFKIVYETVEIHSPAQLADL